jgi:hypothetical protein
MCHSGGAAVWASHLAPGYEGFWGGGVQVCQSFGFTGFGLVSMHTAARVGCAIQVRAGVGKFGPIYYSGFTASLRLMLGMAMGARL